jgi:hypothetical protein
MLNVFALIVWLQEAAQKELSAPDCQNASQSYLIFSAAIAIVVAIAAVVLKSVLDRRMTFTPAIRLGLAVVLAFAISASLVAYEPGISGILTACRESGEFSQYLYFGTDNVVTGSLVLGGLLSVVLFFLILLVRGMFTKGK